MSSLEIKEQFKIDIDSIPDKIDFTLQLFNEGRYDKQQLRTVIRNTGAALTITNTSESPLNITNLYFGLVLGNSLIKLYNSSKLEDLLPAWLESESQCCFYFYGSEIKEILQQVEGEQGVFIISTDKKGVHFRSSRFDGQEIEKKLIYLEDGEEANWGDKNYLSLDIETHMTS